MNKNENSKSDVGFNSLTEFGVSLKRTKEYQDLTNDISKKIKDIFQNYLSIGNKLIQISDEKLYLVGDYENIYEYAKENFDLSQTTTKNVMAIVNRFCENGDYLKQDFKDMNYSTLVELLPVDDNELSEFKPLTTVKKIRSKKN